MTNAIDLPFFGDLEPEQQACLSTALRGIESSEAVVNAGIAHRRAPGAGVFDFDTKTYYVLTAAAVRCGGTRSEGGGFVRKSRLFAFRRRSVQIRTPPFACSTRTVT